MKSQLRVRQLFEMTMPVLSVLVLFLIVCSWSLSACSGDEWPQWRGAGLNSVSKEASAPAELSKKEGAYWRVEMPGPAGSSPIVWGDQVFVTTTAGTKKGAGMFLMCLGTDGSTQWKQKLDGGNENNRDSSNSASPSPSTDGEHVWAMMGNGIIHCFTMDGKLVWKKDLQQEYGKFNIQFGMATTPILDKGILYAALMHGNMRDMKATSVGHVVALDAKTGHEVWHQRRLTDAVSENTHSYASPIIYRDADREFLVTHGADYVIGHSLEDGTEMWRVGGINIKGSSYNPYLRFVASPVAAEGIIVVPTAKSGAVLALKVDPDVSDGGHNIMSHWRLPKGTPDVASPVIYDGLVYLAHEKGILKCLDAETGEIYYQERVFAGKHRSTPVAVDGKIFIAGRDGRVHVIQAGKEYKRLSMLELDEETTSSPAIANGKVYIRTFDALYSFGE